jgi:hypothetical protein
METAGREKAYELVPAGRRRCWPSLPAWWLREPPAFACVCGRAPGSGDERPRLPGAQPAQRSAPPAAQPGPQPSDAGRGRRPGISGHLTG